MDRLYYTGIVDNAMLIMNILQMECKTWSRNHSKIDPVRKPCIQIYGQNRAENRTITINVSREKAFGKTKWSNQQKQSIKHRQQTMHLPGFAGSCKQGGKQMCLSCKALGKYKMIKSRNK